MSLSDWKDALAILAPGTHPVDSGALADMQAMAVARAVAHHSGSRPRILVEDLAGNGSADYDLAGAGLTEWDDDFSVIRRVETPVDDAAGTSTALEEDEGDWRVYDLPDGRKLRLAASVALGETIRVTYSARHQVDEHTDTIPLIDQPAVQALAASFYCRMLASAYASSRDSTIAADSVDHGRTNANFIKLAQEYRAEYDSRFGAKEAPAKAAGVIADRDQATGYGADRLTHPRRMR